MKFHKTIEIECEKTTCASKPGKFCRYVGGLSFGTIPVCLFFRDEIGGLTRLYENEPNGWLQRCPECIREFTAVPEV